VPAGVFVFELSSAKKPSRRSTPLNKIGVALSKSKLRLEPAARRVEEEQGFQKPCRLPSETEYSPRSEA
jgi:hypothetical protein